jgi:hypothetical protein
MLKMKLIRAGIFLAGFGFVAGAILFAFAWFTVSIPDPNAYVNSQSTIIQYSNGSEIGRIGSQNRTDPAACKDSTAPALCSDGC